MKKNIFYIGIMFSLLLVACQPTTNSSTTQIKDAKLYGDENINTPYGNIELQHTFMTDKSSQKLFDAMDFQRASQAYIWSIPLVGMHAWEKEQNKHYGTGEIGVFAVLESLKEKRGIVTGNLTTPYILSFYNLTKGALVVDYPAGATAGGVLDYWQRPIADLGLTGPDKGKGGKYIIVGPEENINKYKKDGVFVYQSPTNNIFVGLRLVDPSPEFAKTFKASIKMGSFGKEMKTCTFYRILKK